MQRVKGIIIKISKILGVTVGIILLLLLLVLLLIKIPSVQTSVTSYATKYVRDNYGINVGINYVNISLNGGVNMEGIYLPDEYGDTLAYIDKINVALYPKSVYKDGKLSLRSVSAEGIKAYIWNDTTKNRFCFDYLVEAFSSDSRKEESNDSTSFDLSIGNIDLREARFRYFVYNSADSVSSEINYNNLDFQKIYLKGEINSIKMDGFDASIDYLSFKEKSGLVIEDFAIDKFTTSPDNVSVKELNLKAPNSFLVVKDFDIKSEGGLSGIGTAFSDKKYKFNIEESYITASDFSAFYLPLKAFNHKLALDLMADGTFPALQFLSLDAKYDGDLALSLTGKISDYANIGQSTINAVIDTLYSSKNGIADILAFAGVDSLPNVANSLFPIGLRGTIKGKLEDFDINTLLSSSLGNITAKGNISMDTGDTFNMKASTQLQSKGMNLKPILGDSMTVDSLSYNIFAEYSMASNNMMAKAKGTVENVHFNNGDINLTLKDLSIDTATYKPYVATLAFKLKENFGSVNLASSIDFGSEKLKIKTNGKLDKIEPYLLGILDSTWKSRQFFFKIDGDIELSSLADLKGSVKLDSVKLADSTSCYMLGDIRVDASQTQKGNNIDLFSQILDLSLSGSYDFENLKNSCFKILNPYLPSVFNDPNVDISSNEFTLKGKIKDIRSVSEFFSIPILVSYGATIRAEVSDSLQNLELTAEAQKITYSGKQFKSNLISIKKSGKMNKMFVADIHSDLVVDDEETINVDLSTELENDVVLTTLNYNNNSEEQPIMGEIKTLVTFPKDTTDKAVMKATFMPSDLVFRDLWLEFEPSVISLEQDGKIIVEDFGLTSDENKRILLVDGTVGEKTTDSLIVSFDSLMIADVATKLRSGVPVSGFVTGDICFKSLFGNPQYRTSNLRIDELTYDSTLVGDIRIKSGWNPEKRGMGTKLDIFRDGNNVCSATGVVKPEQEFIRLKFNMHELPINFAETFISDYVSGVKGTLSANVDVEGNMYQPNINGYLHINNAQAKVNYTNTTYRINDSIVFTPKQFRIKDLAIIDEYGRKANVNCIINHENFRNLEYMARISMDEFLLLNNPKAKNEMVYGKFLAGGRVRISGDEKHASVEGTISNGSYNSSINVVLPESETTATTYSNIVFVSKKDTADKDSILVKNTDFKVDANVTMEIKKNLDLGVTLSRATGDNCKIKGEGNLRVEYGSEQTEPKLYGTYTIDEGSLKMKINKLPLKPFSIEKGSNISVSGPLSTLRFDIKSLYTTRADLATLDESFADDPSLSNTRVPAAAVLTIGGTMTKFNLGYDITLPNSSEDLNERVRNIVNSDELKIREFAYLIALNSFYSISGNSASVSSTMISSLASTSISSGMNTLLGDVLGSNWTVGADITSTESDMSDMEMSFTISRSFFNNRVILSTDLGYQNQTNASGTSTEFTNNFDVEYKLTPSGMFRLKGYRHDNDEFYRQGSSKQGVGFLFTREAPTFKGLFQKGGKK